MKFELLMHIAIFIAVVIVAMIIASTIANAYTIIFDDEYENISYEFCLQFNFNETNKTLNCIDKFDLILDYLKSEINYTLIINNTKIVNNITYVNSTEVQIINYSRTIIENHSTIIDNSLEQRKLEMDHEFMMQYGHLPGEPGQQEKIDLTKYYTKEEIDVKISEYLTSNDPVTVRGNSDSLTWLDPVTLGLIALVILAGVAYKYKDKLRGKKDEVQSFYDQDALRSGTEDRRNLQKKDISRPDESKKNHKVPEQGGVYKVLD